MEGKVESYKLGNRIVHYYSIYSIRKMFTEYVEKLQKDLGIPIHWAFKIDVEGEFIKSDLAIWSGDSTINEIQLCLPFTDAKKDGVLSSVEFAKIVTRLEKKSMMIILALEDPDEAKGEIEDIEKNTEEVKVEDTIPNKIEDSDIEQDQINFIYNILRDNTELAKGFSNYLKTNFGKVVIGKLTKDEADQVIAWLKTQI